MKNKSENNIIFFHPLPLNSNGDSGSRVRPVRMLEAFKNLGFNVVEVTGLYSERKQIIKKQILGKDFLFCYGETANTPMLLTNKFRIPFLFYYDAKLFKYLNKINTPVGIFYRDIYWNDKSFTKSEAFHRKFYKIFWLHELRLYRKYCKVLFMPTMEMAKLLPRKLKINTILSLPPACDLGSVNKINTNNEKQVHLLYIGNIAPPLYDLRDLFSIVSKYENIQLEVICRIGDWNKHKNLYDNYLSDNIKIYHKSGDSLLDHYKKADVFVTYREHHSYLDITLPIKLHEAWSQGLPVIVKAGGIDAKWVERLKGGWIVKDNIELSNLFAKLLLDKSHISLWKSNIENIVREQSWKNRAIYVERILLGKGSIDQTFF